MFCASLLAMLTTVSALEKLCSFDCVILRGLPGSGKSTLAQRLADRHGHLHLEADQHFMVGGRYQFDPTRAADAHAVVARDGLAALQTGRRVAVANTHVRIWEMAAIVGAATLAAKTLCFVECQGAWPSVHDLDEGVIASMRQRWEALPGEFAAVSFRFVAESGCLIDAAPRSGCMA